MQDAWQDMVDQILSDLEPVFADQREQIVAQVSAAAQTDDLDALEQVTVSEDDVYQVLFPYLVEAAQAAGEAQEAEAEAQGVTVPGWYLTASLTAAVGRDLLDSVARVTARLMSTSLVQSAVRRALTLFGRGQTPELVTEDVETHLSELTDAGPRESVGGAVTQAQNEGRRTVLSVAPPGRYFASEVLDRSSCQPCREVDGTEYRTLTLASVAYPSGGYRNCLGGSRCRGTIVTVWSESAGETASAAVTVAEGAGMPWIVVEDHGECGSDEPFAVVKEETGELEGCHATREQAEDQLAALYASEDGLTDSYAEKTAPWTGPLAVEGIVTGDGREFAPGALKWADLPVPLRWNKEDSHGGEPHTVAVNVGRIDKIWREDEKIMGSGVLNLAETDGQRVYDLIKGQFIRGVSIDADSITDADVELVWPEGDGNEVDDDDPLAMLFGGPPPEKMIFHAGRIRAATLVDIPAFAEAYIALTDDTGAVVAGGQPFTEDEYLKTRPEKVAVTASVSIDDRRPPPEWFTDPKLEGYTGIVVTDDGRVYGHVAPWNACHIGYDGECVTAPREDMHDHYMTGEVVCSDGSRSGVGQITVGTGHASLYMSAKPAAEHYDNTGTAVADVAVGNDAHGIWLAGAIRPKADPQAVFELRASGRVSGDWRRIGGKLRLVALLGVNTAGFLQGDTRTRARVAGGQPMALVAAGVSAPVWHPEDMDLKRAYRIIMDDLRARVYEGR